MEIYKYKNNLMNNKNEHHRDIAKSILLNVDGDKNFLINYTGQLDIDYFISLLYSDYTKLLSYQDSCNNDGTYLINFPYSKKNDYVIFNNYQDLKEYTIHNFDFFKTLLKSSVIIKNSVPTIKGKILKEQVPNWLESINTIEELLYSTSPDIEEFLETNNELEEDEGKAWLNFFENPCTELNEEFNKMELLYSKCIENNLNHRNSFIERLILLKYYNEEEFNNIFKIILIDSLISIKYNLEYCAGSSDYYLIWKKFTSHDYNDLVNFILSNEMSLMLTIMNSFTSLKSDDEGDKKDYFCDEIGVEIVDKIKKRVLS
ncbi:MAG: hypothetical protein R3Y13_05615 [bacterium]